MSKENNGTGKKIVAGALLAGAVGYVAGILTAPKSGKDTRKDVRSAASKAMREAEKQLKHYHSELNDLLGKAEAKAGAAKGKTKIELTKVMKTATTAKERVRDVLSAIHEGDAADPDLKEAVKSAKDSIKALGKFVRK